MRHPSEGVLRRLVDEPAGVTDDDRAHVAACPQCLRALETTRAEARLVDAALASSAPVDTDAAWARFAAAAPAVRPTVAATARSRWRPNLRRPVIAAVSAVVLVGGAGGAAANDWLPIFQTQRVDPVEITSTDLVAVPDLSAYGDLELTQKPDTQQVPDAATAKERTGLAVPEVAELPAGVTGDPAYQVAGTVVATFTFSAEKAAQAAAAAGKTLPPPPPALDGSSFRLDAAARYPPGAAQLPSGASPYVAPRA